MPERTFTWRQKFRPFKPICNTKLNWHTFDVTAKLFSNVTSIVELNVAQLKSFLKNLM